MKNIKDYNLEELKQEIIKLGEKPFRAEQIFRWIFVEKVKSFSEMTNLSESLREKLNENYDICNFSIERKLESIDGTKKYLFGLNDGNAIETVLMQYHHGKTVCVSSQIGCKMGCKFCASTGIPFIRNLTSGEIVEQIIAVEQDIKESISNIVFIASSFADSIKPHVLTTIISAMLGSFTISYLFFKNNPIIISVSTKFLLQPNDTNPTFIIYPSLPPLSLMTKSP